jgi:hypothetical protein
VRNRRGLTEPWPSEPLQPRPALRPAWVELNCLLCGELGGRIEDERIVRPAAPGRIRVAGRRLLCGRCGSALLPGDRGQGPILST